MTRAFWESECPKSVEGRFRSEEASKADNFQISKPVEETSSVHVLDLPMRGTTRRCTFSTSYSELQA
jgi:hypothetical protein